MRRARAVVIVSCVSMIASACAGASSSSPTTAPLETALLNDNGAAPERPCAKRWERWDAYNAIQRDAVDLPDFLRRIRVELPRTCADDVRARMLFKLGHYRDPEAVPVIVEQLEAEERRVFEAAARALMAIGLPHARPALEPLRALLRRLASAPARESAVVREALRALGDP